MRILLFVFIGSSCLFGKMTVTVSVIPQAYFVHQIAGDLVDVNIMVETGNSPEVYEPSIKQLQALSKSNAYFYVGMPFEKAWDKRFRGVNEDILIVDPVERKDMDNYSRSYNIDYHEYNNDHSHDIGHDHPPHIWLSFELSKLHVKQITATLSKLDPENAGIYEKNSNRFIKEIDDLYSHYKAVFKGKKKAFLVFHPAWSYIANELNLKEYAIEKDGKNAKISHTKGILKIIKNNNIKYIFVQPQFSTKLANAIASEAGIKIKVADPLDYNWLNGIKSFLEDIASE